MLARLAPAIGLALALVPATGTGQSGVVIGQVIAQGAALPLGYSVIAVTGRGERFTDVAGRFTIGALSAGSVRIIAKHIGYAPLDTVLVVGATDTVRVALPLALVTIQLPAVLSLAQFCAHPGTPNSQVSLQLAALFDQMIQNADRNRLLTRSYPFEMRIERKVTRPEPILLARFIAFDTILKQSERPWRYAPGRMLGTREYETGVLAGKWTTITVPELADFADPSFLENHCFGFGGLDAVEGDTLLRIDFEPAPTVYTPDIAGSIFLDRATYQLRWTVTAVANLTKEMRNQMSFQEIRVAFKEIVPGVPVADVVSSIVFPNVGDNRPSEPSTETHRTLTVRFLGAQP